MKIAFVFYEYPPDTADGGIATYLRQAARMLCARGHQVEVFAGARGREGTFDDGDGITEEGGDCDDADADVHPGAEESENTVDDDCSAPITTSSESARPASITMESYFSTRNVERAMTKACSADVRR